jgi:hypothetical protein
MQDVLHSVEQAAISVAVTKCIFSTEIIRRRVIGGQTSLSLERIWKEALGE